MTTRTSTAPTGRAGSRAAVPLYLTGAGLSLLGNSAISIALPWLVLARTGDLAVMALVATVSGLAAVPATLFGGRLADRFGARRVAVAADVGSALAVAALVVVDVLWGLSTVWFLVLGAAGAVFDVPGQTARQSLLADVARTGAARVETVASGFQSVFALTFLVGPAATGLLLGVVQDAVDVVLVTAVCSAAAAVATLALPVGRHPAGSAGGASGWAATTDRSGQEGGAAPVGGWRAVRRDPRLVATLVIAAASALVTPPLVSVVLPGHFAARGEPGSFGASVSAFAVGVLVGSVLYAVVTRGQRPSSRLLAYVVAVVAMAGGLGTIAVLGSLAVVAVGMAVLGLGAGLYGPVWNVFVAERVDARVRAGVLSWLNAAALVAGPVGLGVTGALLAVADLQAVAVVMAAGWVLVAAYALGSRHARAVAAPAPAPVPAPDLPAGHAVGRMEGQTGAETGRTS